MPQQLPKARHPRYNSRASSFSLCDSHERCFCVCVRERACVCVFVFIGFYSSRNQEQSQEERSNSAFFLSCSFFLCCLLLFSTCVTPVLWYNSSRTSRYYFCDSYERCFCLYVCGRAILNTTSDDSKPHFL